MNLTDLFEGFDIRASGMPGNTRRKISASRRITKGGVLETVTEVSYTSPVMKNVYELRSNMKINEISPNIIRPIQAVKPGTPVKPTAAKTPPGTAATPAAGAKPGATPAAGGTTTPETPLPIVKQGEVSLALNPAMASQLKLPPNKTIDRAKILKVPTKPGPGQSIEVELPKTAGQSTGVRIKLPSTEYTLPNPTKLAMANVKK